MLLDGRNIVMKKGLWISKKGDHGSLIPTHSIWNLKGMHMYSQLKTVDYSVRYFKDNLKNYFLDFQVLPWRLLS